MLEEFRDGQIEVGFVHKGLDEFMRKLDVAFNRLVIALVTVGGLIGSSLIGIFSTKGPQIAGVNFLSFVGFVLSAVLGLWLLVGRAPLRTVVESSSHFRAKGHLARRRSRG